MQTNRFVGTVAWFDGKRGMGFIIRADAPDLFVHHTKILTKGGRQAMRVGDRVEFSIGECNGRTQAFEVVIARAQDGRKVG